jgi:hypothetical protein
VLEHKLQDNTCWWIIFFCWRKNILAWEWNAVDQLCHIISNFNKTQYFKYWNIVIHYNENTCSGGLIVTEKKEVQWCNTHTHAHTMSEKGVEKNSCKNTFLIIQKKWSHNSWAWNPQLFCHLVSFNVSIISCLTCQNDIRSCAMCSHA